MSSGAGLREFYEASAPSGTLDTERARVTLRLLRSSLDSTPRLKILDLGCGQGEMAGPIGRGLPSAHIVGIEWSFSACKSARGHGLSPIQASVDGVDLPFRKGVFNAVIMAEVIEHLVDTDHVLREAQRVLVPGGFLLLSTPNMAAWFNRILLSLGAQPMFSEVSLEGIYGRPGSDPVGHLRLFTKRALVALLSARGFVDIRVFGASFHRTPVGLRTIDRLISRWSGGAAILVCRAQTRQ